MKILAYAQQNGQILKDENGQPKRFFMWEALELKLTDHQAFKKLQLMSPMPESAERVKVTLDKNGFYRYSQHYKGERPRDADSSSLSHAIAIQVLSEMESIPFDCGNELRGNMQVSRIRADDVKIQLTSREPFEAYYPDLICQFDTPSKWAERWGNKVIIEVKHRRGCDSAKVAEYERHGIPVIEVDISGMSIEKRLKTKKPSMTQIKMYHDYVKSVFAKKVYGRIIANPVSTETFKNRCAEYQGEVKSLETIAQRTRDIMRDKQLKHELEVAALRRDHEKEVKALEAENAAQRKELIKQDETTLKLRRHKRALFAGMVIFTFLLAAIAALKS